MRRLEVIDIKGKLYEVYRIISEEQVRKVEDGVSLLRQYWHCDKAFKNGDKYYFVRDIIDIEYEQIT